MYNTWLSAIYKYKYKATAQFRNTNASTKIACNISQADEAGKSKMRRGHSPKYSKTTGNPELWNSM